MKIDKKVEGNCMSISVEGRLDTNTYHELETTLGTLDGVEKLIFDFEKLDYISSAGLRVLLACQKRMNQQGTMILKNVNQDIKEVLDITGFSDILTIIE